MGFDMRLLVLPFGLIVLIIVGGNLLIIIAVPAIRKLREPSNFLYVSMAVADLLVGLVVGPLAGMYEIRRVWTLGIFWCNFWTYSDVLLCTSSILHLCMVSIDRYLVIKHPLTYSPKRTTQRMVIYATGVWMLSFCVSLPMIVRFQAIVSDGLCTVNPHPGYQIYATLAAFYIPVIVMVVINARIYTTVRAIKKEDERLLQSSMSARSEATPAPLTDSFNLESSTVSVDGTVIANQSVADPMSPSSPVVCGNSCSQSSIRRSIRHTFTHSLRRLTFAKSSSLKRNTKAVKTLFIIMAAFVICWLPFFITTLVGSTCYSCNIPGALRSVCWWLGLTNSAINPFLIVLFNKDFKQSLSSSRCLRRYKTRVRTTDDYEKGRVLKATEV